MAMSGAALSSKVQANMVGQVSDIATAHANAWKAAGNAMVDSLMAATHTIAGSWTTGAVKLAPCDGASLVGSDLKVVVKAAIAGVSPTPATAHADYWDAISGAIVLYYKGDPAALPTPIPAHLRCKVPAGTTPPGPSAQTGVPGFYTTIVPPVVMPAPGDALGTAMKDAIDGITGVTPANVHEKAWAAVSQAMTDFLTAHYVSVLTPGVAGSSSTLIVVVT